MKREIRGRGKPFDGRTASPLNPTPIGQEYNLFHSPITLPPEIRAIYSARGAEPDKEERARPENNRWKMKKRRRRHEWYRGKKVRSRLVSAPREKCDTRNDESAASPNKEIALNLRWRKGCRISQVCARQLLWKTWITGRKGTLFYGFESIASSAARGNGGEHFCLIYTLFMEGKMYL